MGNGVSTSPSSSTFSLTGSVTPSTHSLVSQQSGRGESSHNKSTRFVDDESFAEEEEDDEPEFASKMPEKTQTKSFLTRFTKSRKPTAKDLSQSGTLVGFDDRLARHIVTNTDSTAFRSTIQRRNSNLEQHINPIVSVVRWDCKRFDRKSISATNSHGYRMKNISKISNSSPEMGHVHPLAEIRVLRHCTHPHIVRLVEVQVDGDDRIGIILEHFPNGTLREFITTNLFRVDERTVAQVTHQLLGALSYLHARCIAHRDIRPDNIYIKNSSPFNVVLGNFEMSAIANSENDLSFIGRVGVEEYMAPDMYLPRYGLSCDMWSLGVTIFEVLTNKLPYEEFLANDTGKCSSAIDIGVNRSHGCVRFLKHILEADWMQRCTANEALRDPWITKHTKRQPVQESTLVSLQNTFKKGYKNFCRMSEPERILLRICAFEGCYADAAEALEMYYLFNEASHSAGDNQVLSEISASTCFRESCFEGFEDEYVEWVDILTSYIAASASRIEYSFNLMGPIVSERLKRSCDSALSKSQAQKLNAFIDNKCVLKVENRRTEVVS